MKQEVIQDFLHLPGIEGLALVDGRSRPYFCGLDKSLNFQQKRALAQGIQQVVETTPTTYDFFQFQFSGHQVYVHKLPDGLILLVLASNNLGYLAYLKTINQLTLELTKDSSNAIANFQTVASQTLANQKYSSLSTTTPNVPTFNPNPVLSLNTNTAPQFSSSPSLAQPPSTPTTPQTTPSTSITPVPPAVPESSLPSTNPESVSVKDFLSAINKLLNLTVDYLGKTMISNYWNASRPSVEWLKNFEIEQLHVTIVNPTQVQPDEQLTQEQQQWLRTWVTAFLQRCACIIRDFPELVHHLELSNYQKILLFQQS